MSLHPYNARGIVQALTDELDTNLYAIPAISELDSQARAESWPDPLDAPARAWSVTVHQAYQTEPEQRLVCLDQEEFFVIE
jgi:esterase/lipase superfamily enzyme